MKAYEHCINCGEFTGGNMYCDKWCKAEYHNFNCAMRETQLNVLRLLDERRTWVSVEYNAHVYSLAVTRRAPLIAVRNVAPFGKTVACEAHILPHGEYWLQYHTKQNAA